MVLIEDFDELRPGLLVERLTYFSFDFSLPLSDLPAFDEAADVVLTFANGTVARFTWYQQGDVERLAIGSHAMRPEGPSYSDDPESGDRRKVDATDRWGLNAAVLEGHKLMLGESADGSQQVWSCRMDFDHERSLVVALGETNQSGVPEYMPDSLIVTADRALAESYRPHTSQANSWGGVS